MLNTVLREDRIYRIVTYIYQHHINSLQCSCLTATGSRP